MKKHVTYQACGVKLLLASAAAELGKGAVRTMDDTETNHAVLQALKTTVQTLLP